MHKVIAALALGLACWLGVALGAHAMTRTGAPYSDRTQITENDPVDVISGRYTNTKALQALFPDATASDEKTYFATRDAGSTNSYSATLVIMLSARYQVAGVVKHMLIVSDETMAGSCHSCGAPMLGAVFSKTSTGWSLDFFDSGIGEMGHWGQAPTRVQLVRIGYQHWGVSVRDHLASQDDVTESLVLLEPRGSKIVEILRINEYGWQWVNSTVTPTPKPVGYRSYFSLVPSDKSDHYDVVVETYGVKVAQPIGSGMVSIAQEVEYHYDGDEYVLP